MGFARSPTALSLGIPSPSGGAEQGISAKRVQRNIGGAILGTKTPMDQLLQTGVVFQIAGCLSELGLEMVDFCDQSWTDNLVLIVCR